MSRRRAPAVVIDGVVHGKGKLTRRYTPHPTLFENSRQAEHYAKEIVYGEKAKPTMTTKERRRRALKLIYSFVWDRAIPMTVSKLTREDLLNIDGRIISKKRYEKGKQLASNDYARFNAMRMKDKLPLLTANKITAAAMKAFKEREKEEAAAGKRSKSTAKRPAKRSKSTASTKRLG
jgi:hypothetical protein